jgi:hypothetical protein
MEITEQQIIETLATKVMGWERKFDSYTRKHYYATDKKGWVWDGHWNPLQNIADAWQVAEKLFIAVIPQAGYPPEDMKFLAIIDNEPIGPRYEVYAETAPNAICKAALMKIVA